MSDLVDRLRYQHEHGMFDAYNCGMAPNLGEAADRITQLEADKAELVEALAGIAGRKWNTMTEGCDAACAAASDAKTTIAKMEARP